MAAPSTLAALSIPTNFWWAIDAPEQPIVFRVDANTQIATIPTNMMGLSYESTQLGEPEFFSCANRGLITLLKTLNPNGSLRLGGNTSEFTYFKANTTTQAPVWTPAPTQPKELTAITPKALENLRCFLDATGWNCIYGLNLGTATPERVAEEAEAVMKILGPKLDYFQIGNEPNNYIRYKLRPSTWDEKVYVDQWLSFARAVVQRVPNARLSGPDMGAERPWMQYFVTKAVPALQQHLVQITDHFYAEGPPTNPEATMQNLLFNKKIDHEIAVMVEAGQASKRPYRMTEVNSCYLGGKPGVSDTLAAALWAGELTLKLLTAGFSGVNFHGGAARQIRASLGGTMPGDTVAKQDADDSYYTPIAGDAASGYIPRPIYYGMMLAARMAGSTLVGGSLSTPQPALSAYAARSADGRSTQVAVFNKGAAAMDILFQAASPFSRATAELLTGPALDATTGIQFGGEMAQDGNWKSAAITLKRIASGEFKLSIAPGSAALVQLQ